MTGVSAIVRRRALTVALFLTLVSAGRSAADTPKHRPFLLHLNGIGGHRAVDDWLVAGLRAGGLDADVRIYDWTGGDEGLRALQALERNRAEAVKIAAILTEEFHARPDAPIYITAHSGGAGLAVWALEQLKMDVQVEAIFLLAPALSPEYDLSAALRHVKRAAYVFSSTHDSMVLGTGTRMFGTIDGLRCEAAGLNGFVRPASADETQYRKLQSFPYQRQWLGQYGNAGSHICIMRRTFAREFLAPLLLTGKAPAAPAEPFFRPLRTANVTTRPAAPAQALP